MAGLLDLQEMKPTPRNKLLGLLADALTTGRDFADRAQVPQSVPLLGGQGLGSLLLGKAPEEVNELAYGNMPLRVNPLAGRTASFVPEIKPGRKQQVADLALALQGLPGGNRAALGLAGAVDTGTGKAAIVWHGSPHKFDRFDASKIGTGEGAQAYGHGLYLAESPGVATSYKNLVQRDPARLTVDGAVVAPDTMYGRAAEDVARIGVKATLQKIDDNIRFNEKYAPDMAELYKSLRTKIEALDPARVSLKEGNLYKVDLPDDKIARMLDWDRPFSQQAPEVRKALQDAQVVGKDDWLISGMRGREIHNRATFGAPVKLPLRQVDDQIYAAERLRQAGIPGIRYLDGGSRGAGAGTSNFVVFPGEENMLRILERNGGLLGP